MQLGRGLDGTQDARAPVTRDHCRTLNASRGVTGVGGLKQLKKESADVAEEGGHAPCSRRA